MKEFYILRKQGGEGCDYTIGCGYSFDSVRAKSKEELIGKILSDDNYNGNGYWEDYINGGEQGLEECILVEVQSEVDLMPLIAKFEADKKQARLEEKAKQQEESERQLYEKLKKKFK